MATHAQIIRLQRLKNNPRVIEIAARHNLREIAAEIGAYGTIDGERTEQNYILRGAPTSAGVAQTASVLMEQAGITQLRKDAVRGVELIASLPPHSTIDDKAFFNDAVTWAEKYFQPAPIISATVHLDQKSPHCHIIILPLIDGRMNGALLIGYKKRLQDIQASFHEQVGTRYGLTCKAAGNSKRGGIIPTDCISILKALRANPGRMDEPKLNNALLVAFSYNSEEILLALGETIKPIDFALNGSTEKSRSLSCVDFAISSPPKRQYKRRKLCRVQAKAEQILEQIAEGRAKADIARNLGVGIASVYRIASQAPNSG